MNIWLGKICSFGLLCMSFVNFYEYVCASFHYSFEGGMWDMTVLIPDHCLAICFDMDFTLERIIFSLKEQMVFCKS